MTEPWTIIGDINEVLNLDKKKAGKSVASSSRNYLEKFLNDAGCIDIGFCGNKFTWRNKRLG